MNIKKCNGCKKLLENEPYYTIGEIAHTVPGTSYVRMVLRTDKHSKVKEKREESWVDYSDLDFCESCWKKHDFNKWVRRK